jgi:glycosyltransferase involved in cell wall biosynthesis
MKVLFSCGNAPGLPTGYGGQGLLALEAFQKAGADVCVLAWNLPPQIFKPFEIYTTEEVVRKNPHMNRMFETRAACHINWASVTWFCNPYPSFPTTLRKADMNRMITLCKADFFVSLQDIFMYEPGPFACLSAVWMPLHFVPVEHPTVLALADFDMQLPISGWGSLLLQPLQNANRHAIRHISVLPHGRDISVFHPKHKTPQRVAETRLRWNWPQEAFVILMIASNSEESGRKAFDAQLQGFAKFVHDNPDKKVWLHIHSEVTRAYDLGRLLETFGEYDDRARWLDIMDGRIRTHKDALIRGTHVSVSSSHDLMNVQEEELVAMYQAADVLLAATCSEGCGVPILEAQLSGTPVITTRATAMWEETHFGISVPPVQWIARMDFNSGWMLPSADGIAKALKTVSEWSSDQRQAQLDKALPILQREFSNEAIVDAWKAICDIVKAALASDYKAEELQVSTLRRRFLQAAARARKRIALLDALQSEVDVLLDEVKRKWTIKTVGQELALISDAAAPSLLGGRQE